MRKLLLIGVLAFGLLIPASSASAAPIRECGQLTSNHWSYGPLSGAGIQDLTSRRVPCSYARSFARTTNIDGTGRQWARRYRGKSWRSYMQRMGFTCRILRSEWEYADVRCTYPGGYVIRWQNGA